MDRLVLMNAPLSTLVRHSPHGEERAAQGLTDAAIDPVHEARFRVLVKAYGGALHHFLMRKLGHEGDAQDIGQEALAAAAKGFAHYRGEAELSTWVFGIAANLARNHVLRSPNRRYRFEPSEALEHTASTWPEPCEALIQRQSLQALSAALQQLSQSTVDALMLVAVDGLSHEEAAALLGVSAGTVRSRVSRARAALRKRFGTTPITEAA